MKIGSVQSEAAAKLFQVHYDRENKDCIPSMAVLKAIAVDYPTGVHGLSPLGDVQMSSFVQRYALVSSCSFPV